jgi:hypothetical protein
MKRLANIYSFLTVVIVLVSVTGCLRPPAETAESMTPGEESSEASRGFDPLELPRDREIVPAKYQHEGAIVGAGNETAARSDQAHDSLLIRSDSVRPVIDSSNSQVYRVQIFTGLVHGEARQIARVAEEIFDQPVYVEYEVPNYKVRVGDWANRDAAERYCQKARTVGYTNAWVVMVGVNVRETQLLYNNRTAPRQSVSETHQDSVMVTDEAGGADD